MVPINRCSQVMVASGRNAQVADFGLSRVLSQEAISTGTFGTVTHMPPELLTTGRLSKAVDVYAFGVLLWEMCTGRRPWAGMMQMQVRMGRLCYPDAFLAESLLEIFGEPRG